MNKTISIALLAVGVLLIIYGINASNSFTSEISKAFTGSPTDKTIWLLAGGILAAVIGVVGLARGPR
jgi:uncharacterized membrane protein YidH (DUF202 family)